MLDGIDALSALDRFGTVSEAATRLRLTQSAVSKRIQTLQASLGFPIVEPDGRRLRLTARAMAFLERARPIVAELRGLDAPTVSATETFFSLALADSIAASWGPKVVARALEALPGLSLGLHAHRSVLLVESVRLGRYHMGVSTDVPSATDLIRCPLVEEPLLLVNSGLLPRAAREAPLILIEPNSATWRAIEPQLGQHHPRLLARGLIPVESFGAALQMARAGFGNALVPLGLVIEMGVHRASCRRLAGVRRSVSLLTRKTIYQTDSFRRLLGRMEIEARRYFARGRLPSPARH